MTRVRVHLRMHCEGQGTYDVIAAAVAETGLPFTGHVPAEVELVRALAAKQSIEHLDGSRRAMKGGASLRELADASLDDIAALQLAGCGDVQHDEGGNVTECSAGDVTVTFAQGGVVPDPVQVSAHSTACS